MFDDVRPVQIGVLIEPICYILPAKFITLRIFGLCYGGFWIYIADLRSQTCGYDGPDEIPGIWGF